MTERVLPPVPPAPNRTDIAITGRCNLACKYCAYADEMLALHDVAGESWLAFFEELGRLAVRRACLTGGEVFTRPDLFDLIDGLVANRMRYNLLSNGTLITEKTLDQFEVGKRRLRLDYIQVSIDGSRAEIHDRSRPGSFDRAIRGLRLLKEAGYPVTVRVTINNYNVQDLENIAYLLLEDIGLSSFSTNEVFPCGLSERQPDRIRLALGQRREAVRILAELSARYGGRISATDGPLALGRHYREIEEGLAAGQVGVPGRGMLCACGGVFDTMAVLHDGTMVPCANLSSLAMGTIGVDDLQAVWLRHPYLEAVRRRRAIPLSALDTCRDCPYQGFCTGGCPAGALFLTGELNARNPTSCYRVYRGEDPYLAIQVGQAVGGRGPDREPGLDS